MHLQNLPCRWFRKEFHPTSSAFPLSASSDDIPKKTFSSNCQPFTFSAGNTVQEFSLRNSSGPSPIVGTAIDQSARGSHERSSGCWASALGCRKNPLLARRSSTLTYNKLLLSKDEVPMVCDIRTALGQFWVRHGRHAQGGTSIEASSWAYVGIRLSHWISGSLLLPDE